MIRKITDMLQITQGKPYKSWDFKEISRMFNAGYEPTKKALMEHGWIHDHKTKE